jgi:hypothetical protein
MSYIENNNDLSTDDTNINGFSSYLHPQRFTIYGKVMLMKFKINDDSTCTSVDFLPDELASILHTKIYHTGLRVGAGPDDKMIEFYYSVDPTEILSQDQISNSQWMNVGFLGLDIIMFVEVEPVYKNINNIGSVIFGKGSVQGDIILVLKSEHNEYLDLHIPLLKKILALFANPQLSKKMTTDENVVGKSINKSRLTTNPFRILSHRYNDLDPKYKHVLYTELDFEMKNRPSLNQMLYNRKIAQAQTTQVSQA